MIHNDQPQQDLEDLFEVDSFCRQYLVRNEIRALYQKLSWPRLECCLLRNPAQTLKKLKFILEGSTGFLEWPFASFKFMFEGLDHFQIFFSTTVTFQRGQTYLLQGIIIRPRVFFHFFIL